MLEGLAKMILDLGYPVSEEVAEALVVVAKEDRELYSALIVALATARWDS